MIINTLHERYKIIETIDNYSIMNEETKHFTDGELMNMKKERVK